jgi:hypothetical protein
MQTQPISAYPRCCDGLDCCRLSQTRAAEGCKVPTLASAYGLVSNGFIRFSTSAPPSSQASSAPMLIMR